MTSFIEVWTKGLPVGPAVKEKIGQELLWINMDDIRSLGVGSMETRITFKDGSLITIEESLWDFMQRSKKKVNWIADKR